MARSGRLNIGSTRLRHLSEAVLAACDLPADGSAAVALSGGADSSVCAWASGRSGRPVRALHVHHGLPASDTLAAAAEAVASRLGLSITVLRVAVPDGSSFEARARDLRYAAMEAAMDDEEWLLTGHTADDQAETVLINLLRGAGIDGLAGIPARRGRVARPLLGVTRAETRELATLLELPWLDDPANLDPHPLRNRVRRDLLPALEAGYRPGLSAALARMAGRAGAEAAHLQEQADRLTLDLCPAGARLAAAELVTFPGVVAARAIRAALRAVRPPYAGTAEEVALVQGVAVGETSHARLPGGLVARRRGPWVELTAATEPAVPGEPVTWALPGATGFGSWRFEAVLDVLPPVAYPLSAWRAVFDADLVGPRAQLRAAGRRDQVTVLGGSKQVVDALAEAGVPAEERTSWPVVAVGEEVLWVPGVRRARSGWVTGDTLRYLFLSAEREPAWRPARS